MIPNYLKRVSPTRLKPCQERMIATCDIVTADGCCGAIPCDLCLEWETYEGIYHGSAGIGTSSWTGMVGGISFVSYWERNESGECEYVVTFDGNEVYRATCYEGASCRNPAGEVETTAGYESGTLRWSVYESREMELIVNPDTGCRDFFCGSCRCVCEELCYSISDLELNTASGTLPQLAYTACDGPSWGATFTLGETEYTIYAELVRDPETGGCVLQVTLNGEPVESVTIEDCKAISASWNLYGGGSFSLSCKTCGCNPRTGCCPNLPSTLYATVDLTATTTPMPGICPTIRLYGTITLSLVTEGAAAIWQSMSSPLTGDSCGEIADPPPEFYAVVSCGPTGLTLSIGTNESATAGIIWQAFYEGCNGGMLSACDANVSQAFGGRTTCTNWGALSA